MKKLFIALLFLVALSACTKDFEAENQNPYQISDEMLKQDFNLVGSPFSQLLFNLFGHQVEEDLCYDSWMGYMNTPTPFVENVNNTTYYIRWNSYWGGYCYNGVMSPSRQVIQLAKSNDLPLFATWAKLIRILSVSKLTALHGPVIYTNYGSTANSILYDTEKDLYNLFFAQLDSIQTDFGANKDYKGFKKFDPSFSGDITAWMRVVNSLRLRLAMRLSKVDPTLAKTQGEKALNDAAGLIETNEQNFWVSLLGIKMRVATICFEWDDTRMGAPMESFMLGMKDGRVSKYYQGPNLAQDPSLSIYPYKGIRNGAYCTAKIDRVPFSRVADDFQTVQRRRCFTAAEISFLKAEACLRGWSWTGKTDAKTYYENGIRLSFADWGGKDVDTYIADATSKPVDYVDPKDARNNFTASSTVTVAWDESATNEVKLEKIITQKWLHGFTNGLEPWCDFRRTGYPKIPHVAKNDSSPDWGIIPADGWIQRLPFVTAERTGNAAAVADATTKLGGPDEIGTRLYFAPDKPNF
ncbi:MAG TPA: SusD/RagB family nutrient-binding outer membrane lipoprotein [Bacteroidales bacterium]|nr:SusD/RagB family nutrient-binding outer membrane lipoprotein [Bacteroidales bacterium]HPT21003.1 SusD/RagB family nutrient-binding outer membrane lipoprotein [Bacteroidales bacterium]